MSEPQVEEPVVEGTVEGAEPDGVWTQVTMIARPLGSGVTVNQILIGDGHPAVLIRLRDEDVQGEPCTFLDVTAGGLGFTDYASAIESVISVLQSTIDGLQEPETLASARTLSGPNHDHAHFAPDLPVDLEKRERERAAYLALLDAEGDEEPVDE